MAEWHLLQETHQHFDIASCLNCNLKRENQWLENAILCLCTSRHHLLSLAIPPAQVLLPPLHKVPRPIWTCFCSSNDTAGEGCTWGKAVKVFPAHCLYTHPTNTARHAHTHTIQTWATSLTLTPRVQGKPSARGALGILARWWPL